jgi:quinolinate synthase
MPIQADTVRETYELMQRKLHHLIPDMEIRYKAELVYEINRLKKEKGAVILGHNYMEPALYHTVPDIVGDSLELSRAVISVAGDPVVFCGVRFMAETAKILNPQKTVLLPAKKAGCSLAESITADDVRRLRRRYPGVPIVTYINTYADVKAESDVCCTSGNAAKIVRSLNSERVIFLPDEYLAGNVARETGKKIIFPSHKPRSRSRQPNLEFEILGWQGKCEVHERFTVEDISNVRKQFPDVLVLAHPECRPDVIAAADFSGSTSKMIAYVRESRAPRYLLLTECSMGDNIVADNPDKEMVRLCNIRCPHMSEITLEDTLASLRHTQYVIEVPLPVREKAQKAIARMMELS